MRHPPSSLPLLAVATLAALALAAPARAQPAAPAFDAFLGGITECRFSPEFDNFRSGVVARFANDNGVTQPVVNKSATVAVPAALAGAIDIDGARLRSEDGGQSTSVDIPARGSFNGVALKSLLFVLGNENGIALVGVEFAAPRDEMIKAFGAAIKRGKAKLKKAAAADGFEMSVGFGKAPAASLYCDQSN